MASVTRLLGLADAATGVAAVAPRRSASSSIGAMAILGIRVFPRRAAWLDSYLSIAPGRVGLEPNAVSQVSSAA
jgi:hypothetical protein